MSEPDLTTVEQVTDRLLSAVYESTVGALRTLLEMREPQAFVGLWVSQPHITLEDGPRRLLRSEHRHVSLGADTEEAFWAVARSVSQTHGHGMVYVVRERGQWLVPDLPVQIAGDGRAEKEATP